MLKLAFMYTETLASSLSLALKAFIFFVDVGITEAAPALGAGHVTP
jgi:hypothetical protein